MQAVGLVADSRLPSTEQVAPVTEKAVAPVPDPPVADSTIGTPTVPVVDADVISNGACGAPANRIRTGVERRAPYRPEAAFVATTRHVVGRSADSTRPVTRQPAPVAANRTRPFPEPPRVRRAIGVPAWPWAVDVTTRSGACGRGRAFGVCPVVAPAPGAAATATIAASATGTSRGIGRPRPRMAGKLTAVRAADSRFAQVAARAGAPAVRVSAPILPSRGGRWAPT